MKPVVDQNAVDPDGLKSVDDWLAAELALAYQKKSSLETRSIAIVTICGGLGALYVAIQGQLASIQKGESSEATLVATPEFVGTALTVGLAAAALAILAASVSMATMLYREPNSELFETELIRALHPTTVPIRAYLITGKIAELQSVSNANNWKAGWLSVAFAGLTVYVIALMIGIANPLLSLSS